MIKLYNSFTNQVELFEHNKEKEVSMYVCGSTVYNDMHIGNSRPIIFFDVVSRFFKYMGYNVKCDSKEWRNVDYSKYDIVITNPPFSQFKEFILKLNELNIDYIMIAPGVPVYKAKVGLNLSESDFYSTVKNFYIGNYVSEFSTPDGTIKRAWGQWISSIQNDDKTNIEVNIEGGNDAKS